jgi:dGTPase
MEIDSIVNKKIFALPEWFAEDKFSQDKTVDVQMDRRIKNVFRSIFDRDRDRILYSKIYRRQNGKSQIFIPYSNDYIRTRLTHSLEVNQIARTIGKGLGLNLSLIEAISLGHDVGHTPFGHAGEDALDRIMNNCYTEYFPIKLEENERGFKHNFQAIRALTQLEMHYENMGLNLSPFTLWGVLKHTKTHPKKCAYSQPTHIVLKTKLPISETKTIIKDFMEKHRGVVDVDYPLHDEILLEFDPNLIDASVFEKTFTDENGILFSKVLNKCYYKNRTGWCHNGGSFSLDFYQDCVQKNTNLLNQKPAWSFEALVVAIADEIAQLHHDIEDGLFMGAVSLFEAKHLLRDGFLKMATDIGDSRTKTKYKKIFDTAHNAFDTSVFMSYAEKAIFDLFISSYVQNGLKSFQKLCQTYNIRSNRGFIKYYNKIYEEYFQDLVDITENNLINFDPSERIKEYKQRFYDSVINSESVQKLNDLGESVITDLFTAFVSNPNLLPNVTLIRFQDISTKAKHYLDKTDYITASNHEEYNGKIRMGVGTIRNKMGELLNDQGVKQNLMRLVCDHISGMTDLYAITKHHEIFGTDYGL